MIFSKDSMLSEVMDALCPLERFSHTVTVSGNPAPELADGSDVVIWDLGGCILPSQLRSHCREGAVLVYCGEQGTIDRLAGAEMEAADGLWDIPLCRERVRVCMGHILKRIKLEYDLYMTQTYLDTAIDSLPDMLWFKAMDGTHVKVNQAFCSVVGKDREDVTGRDHCYIWGVSPDNSENGEESCKKSEAAVILARRTLQFTEEVKCSRGMRQLRTYKTPIVDRDGATVLGTVGIGHDVTDLGNMGAEIEILLQSMPHAILLWNNKGRILNANAKFEEYFQISKIQVLGKDYEEWFAAAFGGQRSVNSAWWQGLESAVWNSLKKRPGISLRSSMPGSRRPGRCPPCQPA